MPFPKKMEGSTEACAYKKIDNRKTRKAFHAGNLDIIERVKEIKSKNIPKNRGLERLQILVRLRKKLDERGGETPTQ